MSQFLYTYFVLVFVCLSQVVLGRAIPTPTPTPTPAPLEVLREIGLTLRQADIGDFPLRILPLGASITWGTHSSTGNGYRKVLRDQLTAEGWEVNFVGSKANGEMVDNQLEATPGNTIAQVATASSNSLTYKPNIVLINAGTNDCRLDIDIPSAGNRMRTLIKKLTDAPGMNNTLIVLSTLIPSGNKAIAANTPEVNSQYRTLVTTLRKEGLNIVLADMNPVGGGVLEYPEDYVLNGEVDDTHPGDSGYRKMAGVWYSAIQEGVRGGLVEAPN